MERKRTLVLGASENIARYSNRAVKMLRKHGYDVVAIGKRQGTIGDVEISVNMQDVENVHTITLYLNPENQKPYYDYILKLHPQRVIFNPGTENEELENKLAAMGCDAIEACTLVLLSTEQY